MSNWPTQTAGIAQLGGNGLAVGSNSFPTSTVGDAPRMEEWAQWFGPTNRPIETNPYDGYRQATYQMPEAYKGSNSYMTTILIQLIEQEDLWPINYALPFRRDESNITFTWDSIEFTNHMLNVVPEEGVSRLVSQKREQKSDHMVRYGLAFQLEHGFMRTPIGRKSYSMHLEQIKNAVLETAYTNVIEAYLRCKTQNQVWALRYGKSMSLALKREAEMQEVQEFGVIQKEEHGFDLVRKRTTVFWFISFILTFTCN
jgi:hypothetical protein